MLLELEMRPMTHKVSNATRKLLSTERLLGCLKLARGTKAPIFQVWLPDSFPVRSHWTPYIYIGLCVKIS